MARRATATAPRPAAAGKEAPLRPPPAGQAAGQAGQAAKPPQPKPKDLDATIHERMRLAIVSALAVNDALSFNDLKQLLQATDGNLSVHARKLEQAGYVSCRKFFAGRMPRTEYKLTASGRKALEKYLNHMESLIRATRPK